MYNAGMNAIPGKPPTPRPPRQPDAVRARLIEAATTILGKGTAFSIGTVAKEAGVSKSAVQHHFKSREQLVEALDALYRRELDEALARESTELAPAMRYARLALHSHDDRGSDRWRGMLVASVIEPTVAAGWSSRVEAERATDGDANVKALLVRLAADGLWLSDLLATYSISQQERIDLERLMTKLLA